MTSPDAKTAIETPSTATTETACDLDSAREIACEIAGSNAVEL